MPICGAFAKMRRRSLKFGEAKYSFFLPAREFSASGKTKVHQTPALSPAAFTVFQASFFLIVHGSTRKVSREKRVAF